MTEGYILKISNIGLHDLGKNIYLQLFWGGKSDYNALQVTQTQSRCRDEFVWSSIYCELSCSEMLKTMNHELLSCK